MRCLNQKFRFLTVLLPLFAVGCQGTWLRNQQLQTDFQNGRVSGHGKRNATVRADVPKAPASERQIELPQLTCLFEDPQEVFLTSMEQAAKRCGSNLTIDPEKCNIDDSGPVTVWATATRENSKVQHYQIILEPLADRKEYLLVVRSRIRHQDTRTYSFPDCEHLESIRDKFAVQLKEVIVKRNREWQMPVK